MGRRIKEEPSAHRQHIATAAGILFQKKGIDSTSMNEIAAQSGYSKATLYVYFKNKDEIVGYLVLSSMSMLKECLASALSSDKDYYHQYLDMCYAMVTYESEYPFYFSMVLDYINIDFENSRCEEAERKTFQVGEEIMQMLGSFFYNSIEQGVCKPQENLKATIFSIWGMLSGLIQLGTSKEQYIAQEIQLSKDTFLRKGFDLIYESLKNN